MFFLILFSFGASLFLTGFVDFWGGEIGNFLVGLMICFLIEHSTTSSIRGKITGGPEL